MASDQKYKPDSTNNNQNENKEEEESQDPPSSNPEEKQDETRPIPSNRFSIQQEQLPDIASHDIIINHPSMEGKIFSKGPNEISEKEEYLQFADDDQKDVTETVEKVSQEDHNEDQTSDASKSNPDDKQAETSDTPLDKFSGQQEHLPDIPRQGIIINQPARKENKNSKESVPNKMSEKEKHLRFEDEEQKDVPKTVEKASQEDHDKDWVSDASKPSSDDEQAEANDARRTSRRDQQEQPPNAHSHDATITDFLSDRGSSVVPRKESKPIGKQSLRDRRYTIEAAEDAIKAHFSKKPSTSRSSRKKSMKPLSRKSLNMSRLSGIDKVGRERESKSKSVSGTHQPSDLCSEWEPGGEEEEPKVGFHQRRQSWVGSYIVGYDYWSKKEEKPEEDKKIKFGMDDGIKPWYEMPISEGWRDLTHIDKKREISIKKIEDLTAKIPEKHERTVSDRRQPVSFDQREPLNEVVKENLKEVFNDFAKRDLSASKGRMSLANADVWLEKVGLLDHKNLTLMHTGLCYIGAGGSRYLGLNFHKFLAFMEMISGTRKMPLAHGINRLKHVVMETSVPSRTK